MKYFALLYRLNAENRYPIWISNEKDFVVADAGGLVPTFKDITSVHAYADLNHYWLEDLACPSIAEMLWPRGTCSAMWRDRSAEGESLLIAWIRGFGAFKKRCFGEVTCRP